MIVFPSTVLRIVEERRLSNKSSLTHKKLIKRLLVILRVERRRSVLGKKIKLKKTKNNLDTFTFQKNSGDSH